MARLPTLLLASLLLCSCINTTVSSSNSDPEAAILEPAPDFVGTVGDTVTFRGTVDDGRTDPEELEISWSSSLDGLLWEGFPDASGETTFSTDELGAGEHTITLRVVDTAGATGTDAISITLEEPETENTAPTCAITAPEDDAELAEGTVVLEGTAGDAESAPTELTATWSSSEDGDLGQVTPSSSGGVALPVDLSPGTHVITLDVSDGELNCSEFVVVEVIPDNYPPSVGAPTITPDPLFTDGTALCTPGASTDPEGDAVTLAYRWLVEGADAGATTDTLPGTGFVKGETVTCEVTPSDAGGAGDPVTASIVVADSPPTAPTITISPAAPTEGLDDLVCSVTTPSTDADGDPVAYTFDWTLDGAAYAGSVGTTTLAGDTVEAVNVSVGTWQCAATPTSAAVSGAPGTASVVVGPQDSPPTQPGVSIAPTAPVEGQDALVCSVVTPSTDADGDPITYSVAWTFGGAPWTGATSTTTLSGDTIATADAAAGTWECAVTPEAAGAQGPAGTAQVTVAPAPPPPVGKLVFITSTLQNGNLGGVTGADNVCQQRANAAGLSGTFKAWISAGSYSSSPASRFTRSTSLPYVRTDGVVVANDWADLTDGNIQNPINVDEFGTSQTSPSLVWSYTRVDGSQGLFGSPTEDCYGGDCHCNGWTSTATQGSPIPGSAFSLANETNDDWTDYSFANACGGNYRLKCFEQ